MACNNQVAVSVVNGHYKPSKMIQTDENNDQQSLEEPLSQTKIFEDYKMRYITKNKENLEYEKRLIQLNAQIERLKLDMSFMKEQNERVEEEFEKLSKENSKLRHDNENLIQQIHKSNLNDVQDIGSTAGNGESDICIENQDFRSTSMNQREFLKEKASLEGRIVELKLGLTTS